MIAAMFASVAIIANAYEVNWACYGNEYADWNGDAITTSSDCTMLLFALTGSEGAISYSATTGWDKSGATLIDSRSYDADRLAGWGSVAGAEPFKSSDPSLGADPQYFQLVLVEGTGTDLAALGEGKHFVLFDAAGVAGDPDPTPGSSGIVGWSYYDDATSIAKGDWQSVAAVPEPTSGLLLLLGVAGLALRRRRA